MVKKNKSRCCGCGREIGEDEIIPDKTQALLEICNDCINKPFTKFVVLQSKPLVVSNY